jgi:hypothetical protein
MALCRWSNNSDVYSYSTEYGYNIHDAFEHSWYNCSAIEAVGILTQIRDQGQKVPDHAFLVLRSRIEREMRKETAPFKSLSQKKDPHQ